MPKDGNFVSQRNEFWNWLIKKIISNYHTHKSIAESFLMVFRKSEKKIPLRPPMILQTIEFFLIYTFSVLSNKLQKITKIMQKVIVFTW